MVYILGIYNKSSLGQVCSLRLMLSSGMVCVLVLMLLVGASVLLGAGVFLEFLLSLGLIFVWTCFVRWGWCAPWGLSRGSGCSRVRRDRYSCRDDHIEQMMINVWENLN